MNYFKKHTSLKIFFRFVKNLKDMVVDIHTNVIEQGKQLEKVEENIEITKENVQKAEKEIIIANKEAKKNFRSK